MENQEEKKIGKVADRVRELEEIKARKEAGALFCIPFVNYPKLAQSVPGVVPGMITKVTAASGIGKTQVAKALFVREPLEYAVANNLKIKIFYFALEESKQEFIDTMICNYVSQKAGLRIDILTLQGYRQGTIDSKTMLVIKTYIEEIEELLESVEIIDSVYNPTGIYKYCRDYADKTGTHHFEQREFIKKKIDKDPDSPTFGKKIEVKETENVYSHYVPDDPNHIVIVVVDHISLLTPEKNKQTGQMMNLHQTMAKWSTDYALKQITKHWKWAVVNIQQQEQSGEREQFTLKGDSIQKKTEPSLAGLANNKEIQRDDKIVIGVGSPDRYGFESYHDYNIRRMRDTFRYIKILKNRFGPPNKYYHYLFDGATNRFAELPKAKESHLMEPFYRKSDELLGRTKKP